MGEGDSQCLGCGELLDAGAPACAHCGRLCDPTKSDVASQSAESHNPPLAGFVLAIPGSIAVFIIYGIVQFLILYFAADENVPSVVILTNSILSTTLLCIGAIIVGVILAKRGRPATAIFVIVSAFVGLVPVSMCIVSAIK